MTAAMIRSRADVSTDAPARYAKQLVSHLGRKVEFTTEPTPEGATSTAQIAGATAQVVVQDGALVLLTVTWTREDPR